MKESGKSEWLGLGVTLNLVSLEVVGVWNDGYGWDGLIKDEAVMDC